MNSPEPPKSAGKVSGASSRFATTHWTVVLAAQASGSVEATRALEQLCQTYWFPLYAHLRRHGRTPHDAEDLVQEFFARLLDKNWLNSADRARGRFRSYLLGALKHFLANVWDKNRAQKRGGRVTFVALQALQGEERLSQEPALDLTPDREFDRRWALTLLENALSRLEGEHTERGKTVLWNCLKGTLNGYGLEIPYAQLGKDLAMSESAVRVAVHRLRKRYRELLRDEIAQTVETPAEVDEELRDLFTALGG